MMSVRMPDRLPGARGLIARSHRDLHDRGREERDRADEQGVEATGGAMAANDLVEGAHAGPIKQGSGQRRRLESRRVTSRSSVRPRTTERPRTINAPAGRRRYRTRTRAW